MTFFLNTSLDTRDVSVYFLPKHVLLFTQESEKTTGGQGCLTWRLCRTCIRLQREEALLSKAIQITGPQQRFPIQTPLLYCIVILTSLPLRINYVLILPCHPSCQLHPSFCLFLLIGKVSFKICRKWMGSVFWETFRVVSINTSHWKHFSDCTPALVFYK